jgi:transcriptional regulator with XRE-family HTH domain
MVHRHASASDMPIEVPCLLSMNDRLCAMNKDARQRRSTVRRARDCIIPAMPTKPRPGGVVSPGGVSKDLGTRLRQARMRKGFTVRGLARYIGVSPSLLSQIERGKVMPSVGTLYSITNQLELVVGVRWERLTPRPDPEIEFLFVVYEAGAESCDKDSLIRHGGKEYAYMISGRLGVKVGFEEFELEPGDSITFDAQVPHRLWTVGKRPAEAIWVVYNRHGDNRTQSAS